LPGDIFEEELRGFIRSKNYKLKTKTVCRIGDYNGGHFIVDVRGELNNGIKELFYFQDKDGNIIEEPRIQRELNEYFKSL